jgi:MSHA type pilus biogenesis protein MshL
MRFFTLRHSTGSRGSPAQWGFLLLVLAVPATAQESAALSPATGAPVVASAPAAAAAGVTPVRFSFRADGLPIKQALALFARANHLNIVPDLDVEGNVTVEFHDLPLHFAMQALLEANGYYFVQDGPLLRVRNRETRLFQVDYIDVTRAGQGSNAVQITSGSSSSGGGTGGGGGGGGGGPGGSGNEGSSMTVTNTSTINFWAALGEQLKTLVSSTGSFTISSLSGTVLVRDSHRNIEMIAGYLANVTTNIVRQVDLEVEIYEVALNHSFQLGINWQAVSRELGTTASSLPGALSLPSTGGLIVTAPVYGPAPASPAVRIEHLGGSIDAVLDALKQQGDLKVVSKPRLRTLNNQPAVVRVGQDIPVFLSQTTISPGITPIQTTTESVQTVTVGTVLSITPQIAGDGLITLDITPAVSRLVRIDASASGNTNAPVIDIRQASSIVRVRDGATVIMGGLVQDSSSSTHRKVPLLGDLPLLGKLFTGTAENSERTELIFFVTPHIIDQPAAETSVKIAAK